MFFHFWGFINKAYCTFCPKFWKIKILTQAQGRGHHVHHLYISFIPINLRLGIKNASYILGAFLIGVLYLVLTLYKNVVHSKPSFLSDFSIVDTSAKWSRTNLKLKDYIVLGVVLRLVSWNSSTWTEYTVGSVATAAAIENSLQSTNLFRSIIPH